MFIHRRPRWRLSENRVTPESVHQGRRAVLAALGLGGAALGLAGLGAAWPEGEAGAAPSEAPIAPPPPRNPAFADAGRPPTPERIAARYNNFYEFGSHKQIHARAQALVVDPWTIVIDGLVEKPFEIGFEDLLARMPIEERIVRHRCVEAWSMVVPWIGFPLAELVRLAAPRAEARHVRFETVLDPEAMPGQRQSWYPWPYVEGLTLAEATNPLAFMVTGAYGKTLHKQFGAPLRLHLPWKYGFKSIKSIRRISFVKERPVSFWETLQPDEYGFWANVNPDVPHRRWSQADERDIATGDRIPTRLFNGYAEEVAHLYAGMPQQGRDLWF
ncbi:protein-methionine-sulfoxide reductase catalytic subunit MsrP [Oceanicella actignis]|uniref:protein-methionine-sulfoxide reductase catalytic subunit MsrP n=1 Tax=Oceanicella actignis TaxID=1189325 RepID=UPI0011E89D84|nr:protein-methionine-sulfoxide reductase catalytic subunit MsrP [Oceanicella actignis]TYO91555.1 sulfoxide reductase catalytic subunit YedY [Oceanicella actignis]